MSFIQLVNHYRLKLAKNAYLCLNKIIKQNLNRMFQINDTIVASELIDTKFICDLAACKGDCCVQGDAGAPLENDEVIKIEKLLPVIWNTLSPAAQEIINKQGIAYKDVDNEMVTSLVNGADCVFTYYDEDKVCKCAIEKAYREGKTDFYKPISCHLYPIRIQKFRSFLAVNYHKWNICSAALSLGEKEGVSIYEFLKEALSRRFGEDWYNELDAIAKEYLGEKKQKEDKE